VNVKSSSDESITSQILVTFTFQSELILHFNFKKKQMSVVPNSFLLEKNQVIILQTQACKSELSNRTNYGKCAVQKQSQSYQTLSQYFYEEI